MSFVLLAAAALGLVVLRLRRARTAALSVVIDGSLVVLLPHEWVFKSEGNINAVFTYVGTAGPLVGSVIRVGKHPPVTAVGQGRAAVHAKATPHAPLEKDISGWLASDPLHFVAESVSPLLPTFVLRAQYLGVTPSFLAALQDSLTKSRRRLSHRTGAINVALPRVVLMRDLTCGPLTPLACPRPVLCVELKPKWGVLPQPGAVEPGDPRRTWTRHCMHQVLKTGHSQHGDCVMSKYCPRDLYSRLPSRVSAALRCLLDTPQNNLRVFARGDVVFPTEAGRMMHKRVSSSAAGLHALLNQLDLFFYGETVEGVDAELLERLVAVLTSVLCGSVLLEQLQAAQGLDREGIDVVAAMFDQARDLAVQRGAPEATPPAAILHALREEPEVCTSVCVLACMRV